MSVFVGQKDGTEKGSNFPLFGTFFGTVKSRTVLWQKLTFPKKVTVNSIKFPLHKSLKILGGSTK